MPHAANNGVRIHYEVEGQGPPLMLVHGFAGNLENWHELGYVQGLRSTYRLILVDVRGHGTSDKPHNTSAYDFQTLVSDLVAVLDELDINKAGYFGYSMGGRIGLRIPIYAPQHFNALVLGGAVYPITGKEDAEDDLLTFLQVSLENAVKVAPEKPMQFIVDFMEKGMGGPMPASQRAAFLTNDPCALIACIRAFRSATSPRPDEVLPKISIPCLLFVGEADPRFPITRECASRIPGARFLSFPGLDHLQGLARIDLVLPEVRRFLHETMLRFT